MVAGVRTGTVASPIYGRLHLMELLSVPVKEMIMQCTIYCQLIKYILIKYILTMIFVGYILTMEVLSVKEMTQLIKYILTMISNALYIY
jgi:hypothetical protein